MHLADLDACAQMGDALQAAVKRDWMLTGDNLAHGDLTTLQSSHKAMFISVRFCFILKVKKPSSFC
ncbi:hypothetical protein RBA69_05215 [Brenneria goodwinii]|uniref:hypothetical protein n=1 Tax=Brenneria goodwinii TaxID=1109412 RepID=UPI0036F00BA3